MLRRRDDFSKRYNKLKKDLRNEIVSGNIQPGEYILPENTLSEKYNLSRVSARKVLAELVEEGMIEKIPGKGNRVTIPKGCQPVETLRLAWFSNSYEIEIVKKIIKLYESSHPYVKIELLVLPAGVDYMANIAQMIERGEGPDVFMMSEWHFRQLLMYQKENLVLPYASPGLDPEQNYAKVFDLFTLESQVLATPFIFSPVIICVNEQMLKEAGVHDVAITDWDKLLDVAKQCTVKLNEDGTIGQYGFCFSSSQNRWPLFMLQNGGKIKTDDGKAIFANEETVKALEYCVDLMYKHNVSPIYSHGSEYLAESLFAKERVAMVLTTYYFMNEFRGESITWNIEPIRNHDERSTLLLGGGLAINRSSEKKEIAQSFIDFMVSEQAQTLIKQNGCTIPALRTVAEDDALLDFSIHPRNYNIFIDMMPHSKTLRDLHLTQEEIDLIQNELHLLWANMEKPNKACTRIDQLLNHRVEERLAANK